MPPTGRRPVFLVGGLLVISGAAAGAAPAGASDSGPTPVDFGALAGLSAALAVGRFGRE